jgi:hypothetical protein
MFIPVIKKKKRDQNMFNNIFLCMVEKYKINLQIILGKNVNLRV